MKNKEKKKGKAVAGKSLGGKIIIALSILGVSASSSYAFIMPVYDAANSATQVTIAGVHEQNRALEFVQTMQKWAVQFQNYRDQFNHARQVWGEVKDMRGNWQGAITRLTDQEFVRAVLGDEGRDLVRLGWSLRNGSRDIETLPDRSLDALDRIERIMTNKNPGGRFNTTGGDDPTLREDMQEIFGQVPGTRPDIELAHRTIARAASSMADINKAIEERRRNIEQWKQRITAGGLVPGDLERLQLMINAEQQDIQLLNTRLSAINIEVQMAGTGLLAAEESDREVSRARAESVAATFASGAGRLTPEAETPSNRGNGR